MINLHCKQDFLMGILWDKVLSKKDKPMFLEIHFKAFLNN